jgi:predicted short-subunit dehydrogenase-like oxidoreductase (DUF2520 family)
LPSDLPIAIVGAGAVAQALGRLFWLRGEPIVALASRTRLNAERAAAFIGPTVEVVTWVELPRLAKRVLIAVSDDAIEAVARALATAGMAAGTALHTCGAKGPNALAPLRAAGVACGMFHPLQTVASPDQGVQSLEGVAVGIAGDDAALEWAGHLVKVVGGRRLYVDADRLGCYHASAVLASNALVAVVDAAVALLTRAGIEEPVALRALEPLARTSLENTFRLGPRQALTGPIARGDLATIATHLEALAQAPPGIDALYRAVSDRLLEISRDRGLPEPTIRALHAMLEGSKRGEHQ